MKPEVTSAENKLSAVLIVERSERRLLSRACLINSAGLRVITTTTERMATRAKTTNNSINVNDERGLPRRGPFGARSSIRVKEYLDSRLRGNDTYEELFLCVNNFTLQVIRYRLQVKLSAFQKYLFLFERGQLRTSF